MGLNPLEQLNLITIVAIASIFLVTFFTLRKVFFTPLIDVMEKRAGKLERAHARYQEADALVEKAREEAKRIGAEAAETAAHLSEAVKGELTGIRESKRAQANAETEKIFARGREEIARLEETEQTRLKEQLLMCSRQTLIKMIHEVDEDSLRFVVNRVLTAREAAK
jgi:F0F1-type ATP synthase membrane subunit b/b'